MPNRPTKEEMRLALKILNLTSHDYNGDRYGDDTCLGQTKDLKIAVAQLLHDYGQRRADEVVVAVGQNACVEPMVDGSCPYNDEPCAHCEMLINAARRAANPNREFGRG